MFYYLSKLFWLFFQPVSLILVLLLAGLLLILCGYRRLAATFLATALLALFLAGFTTTGALMLAPLEDRFARSQALPDKVDGIIVLGGFMAGEVNAHRPGVELNSAGDRIFEAMRMARAFPDAKVVISGGEGALFADTIADADTTRQMLADLGLVGERYIFEDQSRNTVENAVFSKRVADPKPGETWLLITSAYHMPRSVGCFRAAGFDVVAWPVDYKTWPQQGFNLYLENPNEALSRFSVAIREWVGLTAYWWSGKIGQILPQP